MCRVVTCTVCGLQTWAGCGKHKDVLLRVPEEQRCPGHEPPVFVVPIVQSRTYRG